MFIFSSSSLVTMMNGVQEPRTPDAKTGVELRPAEMPVSCLKDEPEMVFVTKESDAQIAQSNGSTFLRTTDQVIAGDVFAGCHEEEVRIVADCFIRNRN
jgi:hypothetical protein